MPDSSSFLKRCPQTVAEDRLHLRPAATQSALTNDESKSRSTGDDSTVDTRDSTEAASVDALELGRDDEVENDDGDSGNHPCSHVERLMNGLDAMEECIRDSFLDESLFVGESISREIEDVVKRCNGEDPEIVSREIEDAMTRCYGEDAVTRCDGEDPSSIKVTLGETGVGGEKSIETRIFH